MKLLLSILGAVGLTATNVPLIYPSVNGNQVTNKTDKKASPINLNNLNLGVIRADMSPLDGSDYNFADIKRQVFMGIYEAYPENADVQLLFFSLIKNESAWFIGGLKQTIPAKNETFTMDALFIPINEPGFTGELKFKLTYTNGESDHSLGSVLINNDLGTFQEKDMSYKIVLDKVLKLNGNLRISDIAIKTGNLHYGKAIISATKESGYFGDVEVKYKTIIPDIANFAERKNTALHVTSGTRWSEVHATTRYRSVLGKQEFIDYFNLNLSYYGEYESGISYPGGSVITRKTNFDKTVEIRNTGNDQEININNWEESNGNWQAFYVKVSYEFEPDGLTLLLITKLVIGMKASFVLGTSYDAYANAQGTRLSFSSKY
ncbi:hypothetical protein SSYRP_v1c05160 [Spiroplasma syrphidicola EA-1]|uniref:Uncharacterized protein n=1 Tax=Spiroplasma syrphidicola EA-1 TaxID=1276229 RepID=R4ULJ2_9MOLU|nr:hypothetical protein [Spiroplasma syrphidicola]AGM26106.1 hypothetical protein SSYRP_v1c05160 [Spiroplasma syrphidicola EA-1]